MGRRATCPVNASTKLFFLHPFVSVYIYLSASHLSNCNWMIAQRSLSANGRINAIDLRRGSTSTFKDSDDEGNKLCPANHAALNLLLSTINHKCVYFNQITFKLLAIKTCMVVAMTILPQQDDTSQQQSHDRKRKGLDSISQKYYKKKNFNGWGGRPSQIVNENIKFSVCGYSQG